MDQPINMATKLFFILFTFLFYSSPPPADDYTVYSVFVYNFIKYTEWPIGTQALTIGVLNNERATEAIDRMAKAKSTPSMQLNVKNVVHEEELVNCQVIFIPTNSNNKCQKVGEKSKGQAILVITEEPDMVNKGSSISFKLVEGKPRFQINKEALRASGLKMASSIVNLGI